MKKLIIIISFLTLYLFAIAGHPKVQTVKPHGALPTEAQVLWHEMEKYAFVHFSLNTYSDKEWGFGDEDPKLFNPTNFDANNIVRVFKKAGLKGMILTCKHHDGFCLWPTKTTEHNISKSPWRNGQGDMVKEFADACKQQGLKFGVYLSPWDRNNEHYGTAKYIDIYRQQYRELLSNYGSIFESWHDGANGGDGYYGGNGGTRKIDKSNYYDWENTWSILAEKHPNAVVFSDIGPGCRWVGNEGGYAKDPCWSTITFESDEPGKKLSPGMNFKNLESGTQNGQHWIPAEVDFSIRPGWFWHENENDRVKTSEQLFDHYFWSVGRGANMLLNIPPDKRGMIHEIDEKSLIGFGELVQQTFSKNLAKGAKASASNVRGKSTTYRASKVLNNNRYSYWATDDEVKNAELIIDLQGEKTFNIVKIRENIKLGHRVNRWAVDIMKNNEWLEYAQGQAIGSCRLIRGEQVCSNKVRLRIIDADACPCIAEFGLYAEATPTKAATQEIINQDLSKKNWKVINTTNKSAQLAIDNMTATFTSLSNHSITIDLGHTEHFSGFSYLPRQDKSAVGLIHKYVFRVSENNQNWETIVEAEFSNIKNNPIEQQVYFNTKIAARYIQIIAISTIDGSPATVAEIGIINI